MTGTLIAWAMEQRTGSPAAKLVLMKFGDNGGCTGIVSLSAVMPYIRRHCEMKAEEVRAHVAFLCQRGLIKEIARPHGWWPDEDKGPFYQMMVQGDIL